MSAHDVISDDSIDDFLSFHFNVASSSSKSDSGKIKKEGSSSNIKQLEDSVTSCAPRNYNMELIEAMEALSQPLELFPADIEFKMCIISNFMGNLSQCRLNNSIIQEYSGIQTLMQILSVLAKELMMTRNTRIMEDGDNTIASEKDHLWKLANVTLGALRDLACGNAVNRLLIGKFKSLSDVADGIDVISEFIRPFNQSYHTYWGDIPPLQLKVLTSALGVIRNITHSTPFNCQTLHNKQMTDCFIHLLLHASEAVNPTSKQVLPDASQPHREACYRLAGSLINMAEKCEDVAIRCSQNNPLIWLLIESWGGTSEKLMNESKKKGGFPVLHLGLAAILRAKLILTNDFENDDELTDTVTFIHAREATRKKSAQQREKLRKVEASVKDLKV
jgi:hypothetical protein